MNDIFVDFFKEIKNRRKEINLFRAKTNALENLIFEDVIDTPEFSQKKTEIKKYAVKKLAQILFDCVSWTSDSPRSEFDWMTAEKFLDKWPKERWATLVKKDYCLRAYDSLGMGEIPQSIVCCFDEGFEEYDKILTILAKLKATGYNFRIKLSVVNNDKMDLYIGRLVWEWGYQRIKDCLPFPPYGKILFH